MRLYTPQGTVQIVRCPFCHLFFITYAWASRTRCRFCGRPFKIVVSPKARKYIKPRIRTLGPIFRDADEARKILAKLNELNLKEPMTMDQAREIAFELIKQIRP
jgi:integrase